MDRVHPGAYMKEEHAKNYLEHVNKDMRDHPWVYDVEDVSADFDAQMLILHFDVVALPFHLLHNDNYVVDEVWVSTVPRNIPFVSDRTLRRLGIGRRGISVLVEVRGE